MFLVTLALIWALLHLITRRYPLRSARTTLSLTSPLSLHLSTTALNSVPARLLDLASRRESYWKDQGRRWSVFWDVSAAVGVLGVLASQGVLLWAAGSAGRVAWTVWTAAETDRAAPDGLVRRTVAAQTLRRDGGGGGLVLHAMVSTQTGFATSRLDRHSATRQPS